MHGRSCSTYDLSSNANGPASAGLVMPMVMLLMALKRFIQRDYMTGARDPRSGHGRRSGAGSLARWMRMRRVVRNFQFQAIVSAVIHVVPPMIPPPVWNSAAFFSIILHCRSCRIWCISLQINLSRAVGSEIIFLIHVRPLHICAFVPLGSFPLSTHGHRHFQIYPDMFSSAMAGALWAFLRNQDTTALEQFYIRCA